MLVGILAAGAAGCGNKDASTGPTTPTNVAGDYSLGTIQARSLPTKVRDDPIGNPGDDDYYQSYVVTVTAGTVTLEDGGGYEMLVACTAVWDEGERRRDDRYAAGRRGGGPAGHRRSGDHAVCVLPLKEFEVWRD